MKLPSLKKLGNLSLDRLSDESLADLVYALDCCRFAASVVLGDWSREVTAMCDSLSERLHGRMNGAAMHGKGSAGKVNPNDCDLSSMSSHELVMLHAMGRRWYEIRRKNKLEPYTRTFQWRIVNELTARHKSDPVTQLLLLAEYLEADNYAHNAGLPYSIGERLVPFNPALYPTDEALVNRIKALSEKRTWLSREELVEIADYIQASIHSGPTEGRPPAHSGPTEGRTPAVKDNLSLLTAILNTGMPSFSYPKIVKDLEKATRQLAKSEEKTRIELAPAYITLWSMTLTPTYLRRFEDTVRQCYLTLANGKNYPNLGIDKDNPRSLATALNFLSQNRDTLWILNTRYDLDTLLRKYN